MVSAGAQTSGRGREGRGWFSAPGLGLYVTFAFRLADSRRLSLLSIVSGVAAADMLAGWTGWEFILKWPNDILGSGKKVAGILCENMVAGETVTCLVGIGINLNHGPEDFPVELQATAASLRTLTGKEWPVAEGRERLAAGMAAWLRKLERNPDLVIDRARDLNRLFMGKEISFHHRGATCLGICRGLAADGGLKLETAAGKLKVFYSGEIGDPPRRA